MFIGNASVLKAGIALVIGLLFACVGNDNPAAYPRYSFGSTELAGGIDLIPMVLGKWLWQKRTSPA